MHSHIVTAFTSNCQPLLWSTCLRGKYHNNGSNSKSNNLLFIDRIKQNNEHTTAAALRRNCNLETGTPPAYSRPREWILQQPAMKWIRPSFAVPRRHAATAPNQLVLHYSGSDTAVTEHTACTFQTSAKLFYPLYKTRTTGHSPFCHSVLVCFSRRPYGRSNSNIPRIHFSRGRVNYN